MNSSTNNPRRGFTLIEVMLVMVIIVILASFAVVAVGRNRARSQINQAKIQVGHFKTAIELFNIDIGYYPSTQSGLESLRNCPPDIPNPAKWGPTPYMDTEIPLDPWDQPYQYCAPGRINIDSFDVWSLGADRQDNTPDDIGNWPMQQ
ncbi:MAG: type II secretion system major pseudopilin GspG [Pirellulales bacterium]|nr:type II secretion system major pseudopilin GspG [Pirellulales bacterium]